MLIRQSTTSTADRAPDALDRERILAAAFALIADEGFEGLGMRALGRRLNVNASALYWHFRDLAELVELMAASLYGDALRGLPQGVRWSEWMLRFGSALRETMLGCRGSAQVFASIRASDEATWDAAFHIIDPLVDGGLPEDRAVLLVSAAMSLVLGWVSYEQNGRMRRSLTRLVDLDESFRIGLSALIAGFEQNPQAGPASRADDQ